MHRHNPDELTRLELIRSFERYFSIESAKPGGSVYRFGFGSLFGSLGMHMLGSGNKLTNTGKRSDLSEIINGLLYVSGIDTLMEKFESQQPEALVFSCLEWHEVKSFPKQVVNSGARHFMLAMQDVSGAVDDIEHVVNALTLMKAQYDAGKPSYIHCRAGVGRSVMIAYTFVSYLYLCNDPMIRSAIDKDKPLDSSSDNFLIILTERAFNFVADARSCSQFDDKVEVSRAALKILQARLNDPLALSEKRTPDFEFFAELVQLPSFKKLITAGPCTKAFLQRLIKQDLKGWDDELDAAIKSENIKMRQSDITETLETFPKKKLLQKFQADLQHLREAHPNATLGAGLAHEKEAREQYGIHF